MTMKQTFEWIWQIVEIDIELKELVLTGVLHCLTNTMGIETIEFALPVKNIKNKMKMLSLEGGMTWSTVTPERRLKLNSYLTAYMLRVKIKELQMPTTLWQSAFSSLVEVKSTLYPCFEAKLVESKARHQPSMILHGCSGTGDIKTASPLLKMCCLVTCCQVQLGVPYQRLGSISRK